MRDGHSEQSTIAMERPVLLETYAKIVEAQTAYVSEFGELDVDVERLVTEAEDVNKGAVGGATMEKPMESKELSEDEKWKWRQYELDMMRLREQRAQREFEERNLEHQRGLEEKRLEMQRMRLELQKEHNDSNAVKVKTWGDALKNAILRMPNEPVEVIAWFINLERLFDQLKIPSELQAILIRPYLNERAKSLLARCDPSRSADYFAIKKFLLQELHSSPSVYLEKFQSVKYDRNETYNQFSTKL